MKVTDLLDSINIEPTLTSEGWDWFGIDLTYNNNKIRIVHRLTSREWLFHIFINGNDSPSLTKKI